MITNLPREQLIEAGQRYRAGFLLEQGGYTLAVARQAGPQYEALLPQNFMTEAEAVQREVEKGLRDRTNVAADAKDSTRVQNEVLRRTREWRRKMVAVGRMAQRAGVNIPEALTTIGRGGASVPAALRGLHEAVGLLKEHATDFAPFPLYDAVVGEGESLATALAGADAEQERKRLSDLPKTVLDWYAAKGRLYTAIKMMNDAGRALYAGDVTMAARFNMEILYRRGGRPAPAPVTPVTPP